MKVKSINLRNFKRFTDLTIEGIPQNTKLVLIVGPNGSGKSSLFDAFINWYRSRVGWGIEQDKSYFVKEEDVDFNWNQSALIEVYEDYAPQKNSLYVRTAYRNDPDFQVGSLSRLNSPSQELRISRSIQNDQTVSQNYQRLIYETITGVYDSGNDEKTVSQLRHELIGSIRASMRNVFGDLVLNDISDPLGEGTFSFEKGTAKSYNYKNLSGGEKAAFDLLLDIHLKRRFYYDAIWCLDELETHLHTQVQGRLMREIFSLVPDNCQLWLSTHSLGVMRAAQALSIEAPGTVCVIDFEGVNPDEPQTLAPSDLGRIAWEKMLSIALDDLSSRIVPSTIVVCEGSNVGTRRKNFDAEIYNRIFGHGHADVTFVSGGGSNQVAGAGLSIQSTLDDIAKGANVVSLCDRDDRSDQEVTEFERNGNLVLNKRNLESYLFADDVLEKLAVSAGKAELSEQVLEIKNRMLNASIERGNPSDDLKSAAGQIFTELRRLLSLTRAGNNMDAFMRDTLAPLITPDMETHRELKSHIIDRLGSR